MSTLQGENDNVKLKTLSAMDYKSQAQFFLNAFWDTQEGSAEAVWGYVSKMVELDEKNGADGCEVDEFTAHRFLEEVGKTLTVSEMRKVLKEIDIDTNKKVSLTEFLIYHFKADWHALVNSVQGNKEEVDKAQKLLSDAQAALATAQQNSASAKKAEREAREQEASAQAAEAAAKATEEASLAAADKANQSAEASRKAEVAAHAAAEEAKAAEIEVKTAEAEVKSTLDELNAQEKAYNDKIEDLTRKSEEGGIVSRNRAKNELEQVKNEDPLPLRRAKISQEAALRRAEKASKAARTASENSVAEATRAREARETAEREAAEAEAAARKAEEDRQAAEQARHSAEQKAVAAKAEREVADASLAEAQEAFQAAEDYLEEAKNTMPQGSLWWIDRQLAEAKRYLPQSKGGTGANIAWKP